MKMLVRSILVFLLLGISLAASAEQAQVELTPLPQPDLSALEEGVAKQLKEARAQVDRQLTTPGISHGAISDSFGTLGKLYHAYDLLDLARICYRNAGQLNSSKPDWPYLYGIVLQRQGDNKGAIDAYKYVLKLDPAYDAARIRLSQSFRAEGQLDDAQAQLDELLKKETVSTAVLAELGELQLAQGKNAEAVESLTKALKAVPEADRLHYPLALAYRNLEKMDEARKHMQLRGSKGIAINDPVLQELDTLKTGERVMLLRGKLAYNAGDYLAAADAFREAIAAKPDNVRGYINLASALGMLGQKDAAMENYSKALEIDDKSATAHFNLGVMYLDKADMDKAVEHLKAAVTLAPEDAQGRLYLAQVYQRQNKFQDAFSEYKEAVKTRPSLTDAWMGLSRLLVANQQYADALNVLNTANQVLPHDARISHALARMLAGSPDLSLRDAEKARPLAFRVYKEQPTLGHALTAAMALGESGKCLEAAILLEGAIKEQPEQVRKAYAESVKQNVDYYLNNAECRNPPGF